MRFFIPVLLMFVPLYVAAHLPVLIEQATLHDATVVAEPEISHAYYGELSGDPHTYRIDADEPLTLYLQILVPDIPGAQNNISGLVLKDVPNERVEVVAELRAAEADWEQEFEFFGGDQYRVGPSYEGELAPGRYRVEVNTPDNTEKYVLVVGKREDFSIGYFETVRRLAQVKAFFGKSQFAVLESPFVYVPLSVLILGLLTGGLFLFRRRRQWTA